MDAVEGGLGVCTARIGQDFDVDEERSHAAAGVNAVGSSGAQGGCCDVRSVPLPVVGVHGSVGVGGGRGGVKPCDPFLIVVAAGVAVGFVIDVVEVVEGTVFIVNARVEHGDDDAFAVVTSFVRAGRIHL